MDSVASPGRNEDGYLLSEMLVALSVFAVMAALIAGFMGQLGAIKRIEDELAARARLDATSVYLRRVIVSAKPLRLLDSGTNTNQIFDGKSNSIRFAAITRGGLFSLALRDVHIFARAREERSALALAHTVTARRLVSGGPAPAGAPIMIVENLETVLFDYSDGTNWYETWPDGTRFPAAIRIRLSSKIGRKIVRTETVIQL